MIRKVLHFICLTGFVLFMIQCRESEEDSSENKSNLISRDLNDILASDTLRVGSLYESTSLFTYRGDNIGYNYELVRNFSAYLGIQLDFRLVNTEKELISLLSSNEVDLVAYNLYETKKLKDKYYFVYPRTTSNQVLIQYLDRTSLFDITELAGKEVYVKENTIFHERLKNLNEEIGGTIQIRFAPDSLTYDDLIDMVLSKQIEYTLAYHDFAILHRNYNRFLDYHLPVGFPQHSGWLICKNAPELYAIYQDWSSLAETLKLEEKLKDNYKKKNPYFASRKIKIPQGSISPYDELFKEYAPGIGWDWRLLAALAFHESNFDATIVSPAGASGLMQLMPQTGAHFGLDNQSIFDPEENLSASIKYINYLDRIFTRVKNKDERVKFIIASYNSGPAHILDAMALSEKYGKSPYIWSDNVEYFLDQKNIPQFYEDSVVRYGSFNAKETVRYVENTLSTYEKYLEVK